MAQGKTSCRDYAKAKPIYSAKFLRKLKRSHEQFERGEFKTLNPDDMWN